MKAQKNTKVKSVIKIVVGGLALLLAIPFCMGMYVGFTTHTGTTGEIEKTLKEQCDCNSIKVDHLAYGLQFSRKDGVTGEKVSYVLKDCNFQGTIFNEAAKLNSILLDKVDGYAAIDVVQLHFINGNQQEEIEIINGKLQH